MFNNRSSHLTAVLQALFVTFLWSTSWVLIKIGLRDIPPVTFAGLRYFLAFLCLLPFTLRFEGTASLRALSGRQWGQLAVLGLIVISVTQGAQFLGLSLLPAITVSLLLNFTPVVVALLSVFVLAERPTARQWVGLALYVVGTIVYFYPSTLPQQQVLGVLIVLVGVLANAVSAVMGRGINREGSISPLVVTVVSMGVGSVVLLVGGIAAQGLPTLSPTNWLFVGWLAVVNTAFAFPLWNRTLRTLSAVESSIVNSTMLVQIPVLAWLFLGESISWQQAAGMALVGVATLVVQLRGRARERGVTPTPTAVAASPVLPQTEGGPH